MVLADEQQGQQMAGRTEKDMKRIRVDVTERLRDGLYSLAQEKGLSVNQAAKQEVLAGIYGEVGALRKAAVRADPVPADESLSSEKRTIDVEFLVTEDEFRAIDCVAFSKGQNVPEWVYFFLVGRVFGLVHAIRLARGE